MQQAPRRPKCAPASAPAPGAGAADCAPNPLPAAPVSSQALCSDVHDHATGGHHMIESMLQQPRLSSMLILLLVDEPPGKQLHRRCSHHLNSSHNPISPALYPDLDSQSRAKSCKAKQIMATRQLPTSERHKSWWAVRALHGTNQRQCETARDGNYLCSDLVSHRIQVEVAQVQGLAVQEHLAGACTQQAAGGPRSCVHALLLVAQRACLPASRNMVHLRAEGKAWADFGAWRTGCHQARPDQLGTQISPLTAASLMGGKDCTGHPVARSIFEARSRAGPGGLAEALPGAACKG